MRRVLGISVFRGVIATLCAAASAAPGVASAESLFSRRAPDVIVVRSGDNAPFLAAQEGLIERLRAKGKSVELHAASDVASAAAAAPDAVVVAIGSEAAVRLRDDLPEKNELVYCMVSDPEGAGLLEGRRSFGVSMDVPLQSQFELMREASPGAERIGMLYNSGSRFSSRLFQRVSREVGGGFKLHAVDVAEHPSISRAIEALFARGIDFVWTAADPGVYDTPTVRALLLESLRRKVPVYGFSFAFVRAGAFVGAGVDPAELGVQTADLVERVIEARESGRLEMIPRLEPPGRHIAVNLIVADQLGLRAPASLISSASKVFRSD